MRLPTVLASVGRDDVWVGAENDSPSAPEESVGEGWGDAEIGVSAPVGSGEKLTIFTYVQNLLRRW